EQQILNTNRQRQTSLDERIRSLFNHNPDNDKTINNNNNNIIITKDLSKTSSYKFRN
ncbi:unnamed protein product, partial [Rotaria sp. Silwood1]